LGQLVRERCELARHRPVDATIEFIWTPVCEVWTLHGGRSRPHFTLDGERIRLFGVLARPVR
jgi:hypothetical protein